MLRSPLELLTHVRGEITRPVRVAPLVVVPAEHLDGPTVGHGELRVEDAGGYVSNDVAGDQRGLRVLEDAGELSFGRFLEGSVHVVDGCLVIDAGDEVGYGAVGNGDAHRHPVHLTLQLGVDHTGSPRRTGRRWHDVVRSGPRPPRVLMGRIQQALVVGVGVDGGHVARFDAEIVLYNLDQWDDAVGRARSI